MNDINREQLRHFVNRQWDASALPELVEYIRIPNKSPMFDREWQANGHMDRAVEQFRRWVERQHVHGLELEVVRLPGRTPLIYIDIPGRSAGTIMLYGHLDKQPEMSGWRAGLGPWEPVLEGDRLYGRGGADDGYALFAALIAIRAVQEQHIPHARCIIIIEACEESGSYDLPHYIDHLSGRMGQPDLVVCLDSGCGNYDQLWCTTSLRGLVGGVLHVEVLTEGVHSGDASGVVPSSFRIIRQLLDRIDDPQSGRIEVPEFNAGIPPARLAQARQTAAILQADTWERFPLVPGLRPVSDSALELILNRTWRPALSITGMAGMPAPDNAGNVLRPGTAVKISLRLPPTCDVERAGRKLRELLEQDPPYHARISYTPDWNAGGWHAPDLQPWLEAAITSASMNYFGRPAAYMGEGGSIPFMGMLGRKFPSAQFLITGVLGPQANAHGPNEFLHIDCAKKLTCCVAETIIHHHRR
jgi:acetylornithine deacetylase/succinyl-diaminopimelate desuccinylase-like protein